MVMVPADDIKMKEYPELTNSRACFREIKSKENEILLNLGAPHVESFNAMLSDGLHKAVKRLIPVQFQLPSGDKIKLTINAINIANPMVPFGTINVRTRKIFPSECRQRADTYKGKCSISVGWSFNGVQKTPVEKDVGDIPIMLKSDACNLKGLSPSELVHHSEHENTWGGYFIIKGNEKLIRMLLMTRRNYPIAVRRSTWKDRGQHFSDLGILVRSVRDDYESYNNVLHFLVNGTAKFMFSHAKLMSYVPVCMMLKTLMPFTDVEIYTKLSQGFETDHYYLSCVKNMLRQVHEEGLHTQQSCVEYIGSIFRSKIVELPEWCSNEDITNFILRERVLVHLDKYEDKFNLIVFMVQKLFQQAQDKSKIENVDGVMMQEVMLGGHLYQKYLVERLQVWLLFLKKIIRKKCSSPDSSLSTSEFTTCVNQCGNIEKIMQSFLATGSIASKSGLGLMQNTGLVIMAENINRMRYMSHFRSVHRGSFFTTMRTTEARQLCPDAWGFICPVHTPDGTPCGLLNHLTMNCKLSDTPDENLVAEIPKVLTDLGMIPIDSNIMEFNGKAYTVMLEGKILGYIRQQDSQRIVDKLRLFKIEGKIPTMTEIALVPFKQNGQFPGMFIFVGPARMMRPVKNLAANCTEYIGTLEQVYMDICIDANESYPDLTTHMELSKIDFMSNLANLIPMPDYNQSPRNMYQCQMGKQTMGTACHNYLQQADNKLYRLQTPATPLFRPVHHDNIDLDDFAMGTNAIVAVISYTGYDMEDAMIINKAAFERGFAHGSIYKSKFVELTGTSYFARDPRRPEIQNYLDNDGLPHPGSRVTHKCPLYCYYDTDESVYKVVKYEEKESAIIDNIKYCGNFKLNSPKMVCITFRIARNPSIGDKFASRAGQKGICSFKFPTEDLPFTETGLIPDIVFNPHGFPSRMTIAMMIETMAGKSAALHGLVHDATPFRFSEKNTAINYFGELLEAGGYNYYGTEPMYSGVDGREMVANIFFGVVHYQRLRHMVSDKWQVRSTGPIDAITHQPIKGRTRGGGVRFGEMERDALISHGASFLLQDRLFHNSDKISTLVCNNCGTLLGPMKRVVRKSTDGLTATPATCRLCKDDAKIAHIEIPYVFKYLAYELNSVNINCKFKFDNI